MGLRESLFITSLVLFLSMIGATLLLDTAVAKPTETVPKSKNSNLKAAADKLARFNLLSNNPPIPGIKMRDENGNSVTFDKFQGKVVLFNLWATWCPPCIREMPDLNALQAQYKHRGFVVVPVASGRQGKEEPAAFLRKRSLNELTTYYDPKSYFLRIFGLETLPITFLIDRNGNMRGGAIGILDWGSADAKRLIEALLDEPKA